MMSVPFKLALRAAWRNKSAFGAVLGVLALAVALNVVILSVSEWLLLRPLPVDHPGSLVELVRFAPSGEVHGRVSAAQIEALRSATGGVFDGVAADSMMHETGLSSFGSTVAVRSDWVSPNFFAILGLAPFRGRFFDDKDGSGRPVVLSYSFWANKLNRDPNVIGAGVLLGGRPATVIGITPRGFYGLSVLNNTEAYLTLPPASKSSFLVGIARLRDGVSKKQAAAALAAASPHIGRGKDRFSAVTLTPYGPDPEALPSITTALSVFHFVAIFLFAICLLTALGIALSLAEDRRPEIATRLALGASRRSLALELLVEAVVVVGAALAIGIGCAAAMDRWLASAPALAALQLWMGIRVSWPGAALGAVLSAAAVAGLTWIPLCAAGAQDVGRTLAATAGPVIGSRLRLWRVFGAAQIAASIVLLIVAGLFGRSALHAESLPLGFNPNRVLNVSIAPGLVGASKSAAEGIYRRLLVRARAIPGVASVSLAGWAPMSGNEIGALLEIPGYKSTSGRPAFGYRNPVAGDYLRTLGIHLVRGAGLSTSGPARQAIVNLKMAQEYWPNENPVGHQFYIWSRKTPPLTVVGVMPNIRFRGDDERVLPLFLTRLESDYSASAVLQLRLAAGAQPPTRALTALAGAVGDCPITGIERMRDALDSTNGFLLLQIALIFASAFAVFAIVVAAAGIYALAARSALIRRREAGVRLALGGAPAVVRFALVRPTLIAVLAGTAAGAAIAYPIALGFAPIFAPEPAADPVPFAVGCVVAVALAAIAAFTAARQVVRNQPSTLLREM